MFEFHEIPDTNILEFSIDGKVTREDFDRVAAKMEEMSLQCASPPSLPYYVERSATRR